MLTSCKVISLPPVMLYTTPVADSIEEPMRGARVACSAASCARFLLDDTPTPSMAVPEFFITAFTSAKSTFTNPGICTRNKILQYTFASYRAYKSNLCQYYCCLDVFIFRTYCTFGKPSTTITISNKLEC